MGGFKKVWMESKNVNDSHNNYVIPPETEEQKKLREEKNKIQAEINKKIIIENLQEEKKRFENIWNDGIKGKLTCYGLTKLRLFAKSKHIKGYTKHSKDELIEILMEYSVDSDFPIKI